MGATISTYTDKFYDEKIVSVDTKNFNFWEWSEQEKFLRRKNLWHELKQGNRTNPVASSERVGGIVSVFYEEALDHQTHKLEEAYEQNQRDSITIDELKAKLAAVSKTPTSLNQKNKVHNSAKKEPIVIEDEDITISSTRKGSTSTIDTNDTVERIAIANAESSYMTPINDQLPNREVVHIETDKENPKPQPTEEVRKPDESSKKKKLKKKEFTPYIITGHTVPPKLKTNIRDIMLYDIPGSWDAEQITEAINKSLGSLIKATLRKQGKYYSVKATTHDNYKQRQENKKKAGGKNNKKSDSNKKDSGKKKLKDTSSLSKKNSGKKRGGSKQDSVVDILAKALAKIMVGHEKSESRKGKKNKACGSSRS
ncbi:hypothetical protein C1645_755832 [Glomus cerebriforme]|uniref:Uncharacterized protein n=1 Tax=Glomus cerebriforme TaxID=658196 RepID=A0A397TMN0_9GLOM|nr:hypothetical protein C1645_755832 [Glomus cerebriforme]